MAIEKKTKAYDKAIERAKTYYTSTNFKIGDWVVNRFGDAWRIDSFDSKNYQVSNGDKYCYFPIKKHDEMRLWTVKDAKDGDVLTCNEEILLFKSYSVQGRISLYCWYNGQTNNFHSKGVVDTSLTTRNKMCPATIEQRELLFKKMKDAGYEWNNEKKELKKVDEIEESYFFDDFRNSDVEVDSNEDSLITTTIKYKNEQNPAWSKEDDNCLSTIIAEFSKCAGKSVSKDEWMRCNDFLNSIRDRVQSPPKQKWSEENERIYKSITYSFANNYPLTIQQQEFVKSLKSRKLCVYNPYKAVVESIAKMCNKYENCMCDEKEAKDFLANVAVKCREAAEYDKKYMEE